MVIGQANGRPRHYIFDSGSVHGSFPGHRSFAKLEPACLILLIGRLRIKRSHGYRHSPAAVKRNSCRQSGTGNAHLIACRNDCFQSAVIAQSDFRSRGTTDTGLMSIRYPQNSGRFLKRASVSKSIC